MRYEPLAEAGLSYAPCRYGISRTYFRGPRKPLDGRHIACIGGTGTYGKYIRRPFPMLLESALDETCVNFGVVNAGIDVFLSDPVVMSACQSALVTVLQVMGAQNMSNRFYRVHPRRNDRFVSASTVLRALYTDVDFSEFHFTRHMLGALYTRSPEKFEILREELQRAWLARMTSLIETIRSPVLLLWFSEAPLDDEDWSHRPNPLRLDPLFVNREMIEQLRSSVRNIIVARPSPMAMNSGTEGMVFPLLHSEAATEMLGVLAHEEAAELLERPIKKLIGN